LQEPGRTKLQKKANLIDLEACVPFLFHVNNILSGESFLSGEIRYYRGLHKVKVVTQSEGHWIVEALEDFDDVIDKQTNKVKAGEQRIVPPNLVFKEKTLPPTIKEHAYELEMEKKLKRIVARAKKKKANKKTTG
jgi:hypothetical protein